MIIVAFALAHSKTVVPFVPQKLTGRVIYSTISGSKTARRGHLALGLVQDGLTRWVKTFPETDEYARTSLLVNTLWLGFVSGGYERGRPAALDLRNGHVRVFPGEGRCTEVAVSPDGRTLLAFVTGMDMRSVSRIELRSLPSGRLIHIENGYKAAFWINKHRVLWVEDRLDERPLIPMGFPSNPSPSRMSRIFGLMDARSGASHPISLTEAERIAPVVVRALARHRSLTGGFYYPGAIGLYISPDALAALISVNKAMSQEGFPSVTELLLHKGVVRTVVGYERSIQIIGWKGHSPVGYDGYGSTYGIGLVDETDGRYRKHRINGPDTWIAFAGR